MQFIKESEFYSVVLLGSFNPPIYHPFWLKEKNLINQEDINVQDLVVQREFSKFRVGNWLEISITEKRAEFRVRDASKLILLRDLVLGCLGALPEEPIVAFGLNHGEIYNLENKTDYYAFGARLCPLQAWKSFSDPRLQTIVIEDNQASIMCSKKSIIIQPADVKGKRFCVDFNMNYHNDLPAGGQKSLDAIEKIRACWSPCFTDYETVIINLKNIVTNEQQ